MRIRTILFAVVSAVISAVVASGAVYFLVIRPKVKTWGVDPAETELSLPGDDLIAEPTAIETRGIAIEAPTSAVWPWLVQMGYQRAGWYSYDTLDKKAANADRILPEFQHLAAGEIMPTHPGGGFRVEIVEPEKSLVLYIDTELVQQQARRAEAEDTTELPMPGQKATGALGKTAFPDFAASWAFYLQSTDDGNTRLIERFRAQTPGNGPASAVLGEIMGTGIVLMTRKQMLGIKQRVEAAAAEPADEPIRKPVEEPVLS